MNTGVLVHIGKKKIRAELCSSAWSKARGMMFRKKPIPLLFDLHAEKICSLHMWFVFFPIDVVFINAKKQIVEIKEDFSPWAFYTPREKAQFVLELPLGSVASLSAKRAQEVKIEN